MSKPTTLYDKIWNDHLVHEADDGTCLPSISIAIWYEGELRRRRFETARNGAQGPRGGEDTGRGRPQHPTTDRSKPNPDPESIEQMRVMAENARNSASNITTNTTSVRASCM
jgi:3-isopropylmalate/(R)-2-methylmalate dehydratase large subunit